jgi:hypothetical protein
MAREFEELALDGYNYPTWTLSVNISLAFYGIMSALTPPAEGEAAFLDTYKYQTLYIQVSDTIHHPEPPPPPPRLNVRISDGGGAS